MTKACIAVVPQRYNGRAWVQCEVHRAQQWAVARVQGKRLKSVIARYSTKAQAETVATTERKRAEGPYRPYPKPGARLLRRPISSERHGFEDASLEDDDAFLRSL